MAVENGSIPAGQLTLGFERASAVVLVIAKTGHFHQVRQEVSLIDGVMETHGVAGVIDIVSTVEQRTIDDIGQVVERIQSVEGVANTFTLPILDPQDWGELREGWE